MSQILIKNRTTSSSPNWLNSSSVIPKSKRSCRSMESDQENNILKFHRFSIYSRAGNIPKVWTGGACAQIRRPETSVRRSKNRLLSAGRSTWPRDRPAIERYHASPHSRPINVFTVQTELIDTEGLHGLDLMLEESSKREQHLGSSFHTP